MSRVQGDCRYSTVTGELQVACKGPEEDTINPVIVTERNSYEDRDAQCFSSSERFLTKEVWKCTFQGSLCT